MEAIIFGADVSHPSPDQSHIPSVAAVSIFLNPSYLKIVILLILIKYKLV